MASKWKITLLFVALFILLGLLAFYNFSYKVNYKGQSTGTPEILKTVTNQKTEKEYKATGNVDDAVNAISSMAEDEESFALEEELSDSILELGEKEAGDLGDVYSDGEL